MSKILKIALCSEQEIAEAPVEEKTIQMTGPLSEVYTKALQLVYAKTEDKNDIVALESQANDAIMAMALIRAKKLQESSSFDINKSENEYVLPQKTFVHVADVNTADSNSILLATNDLLTNKEKYPESREILVIDGGDENPAVDPNVEVDVDPNNAKTTLKDVTENICKGLGIEVYYNFESLVTHL